MSARVRPVAGNIVGQDLLILPALGRALSPGMFALLRAYEGAFFYAPADDGDGDAAAARWVQAAEQIADHKPTCMADVAGKIMLGLHYMHPEQVDGELAIDSTQFEMRAAGKILCAALGEMIWLSGADPSQMSDRVWNVARETVVDADAALAALPSPNDDNAVNDAVDTVDEAVDEWIATRPPSPRHALERLHYLASHEAVSHNAKDLSKLAIECAAMFGMGGKLAASPPTNSDLIGHTFAGLITTDEAATLLRDELGGKVMGLQQCVMLAAMDKAKMVEFFDREARGGGEEAAAHFLNTVVDFSAWSANLAQMAEIIEARVISAAAEVCGASADDLGQGR